MFPPFKAPELTEGTQALSSGKHKRCPSSFPMGLGCGGHGGGGGNPLWKGTVKAYWGIRKIRKTRKQKVELIGQFFFESFFVKERLMVSC